LLIFFHNLELKINIIASQEVWRLTADFASFDLMTPKAFLDESDRLVNRYQPNILEIDLHPFYQKSPRISDSRDIGQGLTFLNHYLCNQCVTDPKYWLELLFQALQGIEYNGMRLLISDRIHSGIDLAKKIKPAIDFLSQKPHNQPYAEFRFHLQELGLEAGWGNNAGRIRETLELLQRLIDTPQPSILEAFVARIPAVFRVVLRSFFGVTLFTT
jgi:sucrose synthase